MTQLELEHPHTHATSCPRFTPAVIWMSICTINGFLLFSLPFLSLSLFQVAESQGRVRIITSDGEFERELRQAGETLVVVDFTADWWVKGSCMCTYMLHLNVLLVAQNQFC